MPDEVEFDGSAFGSVDVSVAAGAWTDLTVTSFNDLQSASGTALTGPPRFRRVIVKNTHATQVLFVQLFQPGGGGATADTIQVLAGEIREIPLRGLRVTGVSLQADGECRVVTLGERRGFEH